MNGYFCEKQAMHAIQTTACNKIQNREQDCSTPGNNRITSWQHWFQCKY